MDCQGCGRRDALIHLTEITEGEVVNIWLCPDCAAERKTGDQSLDALDVPLFGPRNDFRSAFSGEGDLLAAFLGKGGQSPLDGYDEAPAVCPVCGFTQEEFRRTSHLGCPRCYRAFAGSLRTMLSRLHGRTIHLGKAPQTSPLGPNPLAEMTRTRVALEKAVSAEEFEEAARLRDLLKELQSQRDLQRGDPS